MPDEVSAEALEEQYGHWGSHPDFPAEDWMYEAGNGDTRLGYWDWVVNKLQGG